ncbi:MAG: hypothetical protein KME40_22235 [Komarekiella atlantica HA4396-MV6]|jgi:hypothetical protein|nr:hypothetical protein [Komarekiella atlantica HA4396-MV6]
MTVTLDTFKSPEFRGNFSKLPICQLLNGKNILFVKSDNIKLSGWVKRVEVENLITQLQATLKGKKFVLPEGYDLACGTPFVHTYRNGNSESGLAFECPRIHVLASSPRMIEVNNKGAEAGIGRKGDIIGNFETWHGQSVRESHSKEFTTLRTLHMIYLVDTNGSFLHKVPLVLTVHGGAAAFFGQQLENFYKLVEIAYSDSQDDSFYTLNEQARAVTIFQPTFDTELVGTDARAEVCAVVGFNEPSAENVKEFFNLSNAEKIWGTQQSLSGFASRYLKQFEKFHQITPGVEIDEFPEEQFGETMPRNQVDGFYHQVKLENLTHLQQDADPDNF